MAEDAKEKSEKEKKVLRLELSRTALFFWSLGFLIFLGWIFTLGVLAGRGLLPSGANTLAELKNQIVKLQEMLGHRDASELDEIKAIPESPDFVFYDELSKKKIPEIPSRKEPPIKKSVKQKAPKTDHEKKPAASAKKFYVVQVASLDTEKQASKMVNRLVNKGYPAYHYKVFIKGRSYFRVRCGTFGTKAEPLERNKIWLKRKN
ncbi:sporulation and cell division repeat protein [delta proteobacterium NaphS2]|nr:sporulation and cell division repeat protein [delta proteobacterium NaphS2]